MTGNPKTRIDVTFKFDRSQKKRVAGRQRAGEVVGVENPNPIFTGSMPLEYTIYRTRPTSSVAYAD